MSQSGSYTGPASGCRSWLFLCVCVATTSVSSQGASDSGPGVTAGQQGWSGGEGRGGRKHWTQNEEEQGKLESTSTSASLSHTL